MSVFHTILVFSIGVVLCTALRDEQQKDTIGTQAGRAHLLSVTKDGHFVQQKPAKHAINRVSSHESNIAQPAKHVISRDTSDDTVNQRQRRNKKGRSSKRRARIAKRRATRRARSSFGQLGGKRDDVSQPHPFDILHNGGRSHKKRKSPNESRKEKTVTNENQEKKDTKSRGEEDPKESGAKESNDDSKESQKKESPDNPKESQTKESSDEDPGEAEESREKIRTEGRKEESGKEEVEGEVEESKDDRKQESGEEESEAAGKPEESKGNNMKEAGEKEQEGGKDSQEQAGSEEESVAEGKSEEGKGNNMKEDSKGKQEGAKEEVEQEGGEEGVDGDPEDSKEKLMMEGKAQAGGEEEVEGQHENAQYAEKVKDAKTLTTYDQLMLEVGWLVMAIAAVAAFAVLVVWWPYQYIGNKDFKMLFDDNTEEETSRQEQSPTTKWLYESMWGGNEYSYFFNSLIISVSLLNFVIFALQTEVRYERHHLETPNLYFGVPLKSWVIDANFYLQIVTVPLFGALIVMRVLGSAAHPVWDKYGTSAPVAFLCGDFYTHVEILALIPSILDTILDGDDYMNLTFISLARTVEMMSRQGSIGSALRQVESLKEEVSIIRMIFGYAMLLWVVMSGLYYVANHDNPEAEWEAAKVGDHLWQRFASIPSSMFFVLINLTCEFPIADVHVTPFQRILAMITCIIGVPLFAIPTGIIGSALQDKTTQDIDDREQELNRRDSNDNDQVMFQAQAILDVIESETWPHKLWAYLVFVLSFGSVITYFFWTASIAGPLVMFGLDLSVRDHSLAFVDGVVGSIFCVHLGYDIVTRLRSDELRTDAPFFLTFRFPVGVLSSIPGMVHCALVLGGVVPLPFQDLSGPRTIPVLCDFLRAACVMRLLKPERYIGAFQVMADIMYENKSLLQATGFVSSLLLLFFSTLLYYTERKNPDEELRDYYGSAARAMWAELINLHGEWVWCDYTAQGKAICTIIDFIAIGICMVPIAVFTNGFTDRLSSSDGETSVAMQPWQHRYKPEEEGTKRSLYDLFYSHLHVPSRALTKGYNMMCFASASTTILSVVVTATLTLHRFDHRNKHEPSFYGIDPLPVFYALDIFCVVFFSVELLLRCMATNGCHIASIAGLCDVVSLAAFIATLTPQRNGFLHPDYNSTQYYDDIMVPARLLRCFCLESYTHALHTIANVVYVNRKPLAKSFYALVCIWYIFGTCLYLCEREWPGQAKVKADPMNLGKKSVDDEDAQDERSMQDRYADILTGLQYALVHLTGDYPIADYKLQSMPFHFIFCTAGLCTTAAFTGIFTAGFKNYLEKEHALNRKEQAQKKLQTLTSCVVLVQFKWRRLLKRRRIGGQNSQAIEGPQHPFQSIRDLLGQKNSAGETFVAVCTIALVVNILNTMASTVDIIEASSTRDLEMIELATASVFLVEYVFKLMAGNPPFSNFFHPMRLLDLFCLTPSFFYWYNGGERLKAVSGKGGENDLERIIECAMIFRAIRIFDIPSIRREAKRTWGACGAAASSLWMPTVLAMSIWIFTASIFMWLENYNKGPTAENMSTVPDALYWTSIFIIGEWANVDFAVGSTSRLCIFYCLVGVCIFAIPVGIISESVQNALETIVEEREELARLYGLGSQKKGKTNQRKSITQLRDEADACFGESFLAGGSFNGGGSSNECYGNASSFQASQSPVIPGSTATPCDDGPQAEPMYMPRCPNAGSAMFVPRPPGALAQTHRQSVMGGNNPNSGMLVPRPPGPGALAQQQPQFAGDGNGPPGKGSFIARPSGPGGPPGMPQNNWNPGMPPGSSNPAAAYLAGGDGGGIPPGMAGKGMAAKGAPPGIMVTPPPMTAAAPGSQFPASFKGGPPSPRGQLSPKGAQQGKGFSPQPQYQGQGAPFQGQPFQKGHKGKF